MYVYFLYHQPAECFRRCARALNFSVVMRLNASVQGSTTIWCDTYTSSTNEEYPIPQTPDAHIQKRRCREALLFLVLVCSLSEEDALFDSDVYRPTVSNRHLGFPTGSGFCNQFDLNFAGLAAFKCMKFVTIKLHELSSSSNIEKLWSSCSSARLLHLHRYSEFCVLCLCATVDFVPEKYLVTYTARALP